ncbi:hypothetical protein AUC69_08545 [Methyloceanibacter superfactus]|uniref:GTP-binding protein Era n=1 Tax=Methyloceanibacter superfactus TaxID=1774969 RepID=A0A1E3W1N1_9HYPH|nr:DUF1491 family protein [Methyloceanibacter superfactus]ODR99659.1 hypothetical protein AUC69_08545 [Methyloceanibacter superfactus]
MRVKSEIWVAAYLRRCQAATVPAVIVRRGDAAAGAIFISVDRLDGTVCLYGPAPAGLEGSDTDRRWVRCLGAGPVASGEASIYLARQREFDEDLWIIEIEDRQGRHFLDEAAVED